MTLTPSSKKRSRFSFDNLINSVQKSAKKQEETRKIQETLLQGAIIEPTKSANGNESNEEPSSPSKKVSKLIQDSEKLVGIGSGDSLNDDDENNNAERKVNLIRLYSIFQRQKPLEDCFKYLYSLKSVNYSNILEIFLDLGLSFDDQHRLKIFRDEKPSSGSDEQQDLCNFLRSLCIKVFQDVSVLKDENERCKIASCMFHLYLTSDHYYYLPELQSSILACLENVDSEKLDDLGVDLKLKFKHCFSDDDKSIIRSMLQGLPNSPEVTIIKLHLICDSIQVNDKNNNYSMIKVLLERLEVLASNHRKIDNSELFLIIHGLWAGCCHGNPKEMGMREKVQKSVKDLYALIPDAGIDDMERVKVKDLMLRFTRVLSVLSKKN